MVTFFSFFVLTLAFNSPRHRGVNHHHHVLSAWEKCKMLLHTLTHLQETIESIMLGVFAWIISFICRLQSTFICKVCLIVGNFVVQTYPFILRMSASLRCPSFKVRKCYFERMESKKWELQWQKDRKFLKQSQESKSLKIDRGVEVSVGNRSWYFS